jgi:hypothetical protein
MTNDPIHPHHKYSWKIVGLVITAAGSIILSLTSFIWSGISTKLDKIENHDKKFIIMEEKLNSDEAQWRIIQQQNTKIQSLEVEIEVLEKLVNHYADDEHNKTITVNLKGVNDAFSMDTQGDGAPDDSGDSGSDDKASSHDSAVKKPKPMVKVTTKEPKKLEKPDYKKILDDLDKIQEEEVDDYKQRAIQLQQRQNK